MKRLNWIFCAAAIAAVIGFATPAANAQSDFGPATRAPGPEGQLFFSILSQYFDRPTQSIDNWSRRFRNSDDLAVFFYIVQRSWSSPEQVYAIRQRQLPWYEVSRQCGVPLNVWYVAHDGRPSGRYSKPYQQYDRHRQDPQYLPRLSDKEIRDLVAVRMAHEYYGVSSYVAMEWRRSGLSIQKIMTREYRKYRHQREPRYTHNDPPDYR